MVIAIVTRNRAKSLRRLLDSLVAQTVRPEGIVVIDNGSKDGTAEVVKEFSKVLPIKSFKESRIGIPFARNKALKVVNSEILAFIDDDCEAHPSWMEEIIDTHNKHPEIAAVQGRVQSYPEKGIFPAIFETVYAYWIEKNTYDRRYLKVLDTKNTSLNKRLIDRLGLKFDINFKRGSDVDFANQLLNKNQRILYARSVLVRHWERTNPISFIKQRVMSGRLQAMLEMKWPSSLQAFEKSRARYVSFMKSMGKDLPWHKRLMVKTFFKIYGPLFKLSFERYKYDDSLLELSPDYKMTAKISIGVITKDRPETLKRCLFSLLKQTVKPAEIIVVDGSRGRETKEVVSKFSKRLNIQYVLQKKTGISNARNLVLLNSKQKIVGFVDDDCEAEVGWVEEMVEAHRRSPEADVVQGSCEVKPYSGLVSRIYQEDYNNWILNNLQSKYRLVRADIENSSIKVGNLRRKKIRFNEEKKFYYSDDVDLSYQITFGGGLIAYAPKAVLNVSRRGLLDLLKQRVRKGYSAALTDIKWGEVQNLHMLILKGRIIPLVNQDLRPALTHAFRELPGFGILGRVCYGAVNFLYKKIYTLSYSYNRSKFDFEFGRLNKDYLPPSPMSRIGKLSITIMIITRDRHDGLTRLLNALLRQTHQPDQVLIIDSSNIRVDTILKEFPSLPIKCIYEKEKGYSVARNRGLRAVRTDLFATVDDDESVPENWVESILKVHNAYPEATAVQGKIMSEPNNSVLATVEQLHMNKWFLRNLEVDGRFNTLSTKNSSFKTVFLRKFGIRFNEMPLFNKYGGEDVDIANQIVSKSLEIRYSAAICSFHYERKTLLDYLKQRFRKGGSGALLSSRWGGLPYRKFYSFCPRIIEPFIVPLKAFPLKKIWPSFLLILPVYYLAEAAFVKGRKKVEVDLRGILSSLQTSGRSVKSLPPASIGVIVDREETVKPLVEALLNQSLRTKKIYFYIHSGDNRNRKIIEQILDDIEVIIIKSQKKRAEIINDLIKDVGAEILCVLDSKCIPDRFWHENLVRGVVKSAGGVAQGQIIFNTGRAFWGLLDQFIWQTQMRNSMFEGREDYLRWVRGQLPHNYRINILETNNFGMKLSGSKVLNLDTNLSELAAKVMFARRLALANRHVTMEVRAVVNVNMNMRRSMLKYFKEGYSDSEIFEIKESLLKSQRSLISLNVVKRVAAFLFYFSNKGYFWQGYLLFPGYLTYLLGLYCGILRFGITRFKPGNFFQKMGDFVSLKD